jgi:hypothetical protein
MSGRLRPWEKKVRLNCSVIGVWRARRSLPASAGAKSGGEGSRTLFPMPTSTKIQEQLYPRGFRESKPSWKCLDGAGCY